MTGVVDGKVWLVLVVLIVALAIAARLVYVASRRMAEGDTDHFATETPALAPVQPIGGRIRFICRICRQPAVHYFPTPGDYLAAITDPIRRLTCTSCTQTLTALDPEAAP